MSGKYRAFIDAARSDIAGLPDDYAPILVRALEVLPLVYETDARELIGAILWLIAYKAGGSGLPHRSQEAAFAVIDRIQSQAKILYEE